MFTLEDESGSIVVGRLRVCWFQELKVPEVTEGEEVMIEAEIFGPEQDSEYRKDYPGELPTTYAVVMNIHLKTSEQPHGKIDFETFRLISTGMTRDEVLKLAGSPAEEYDCITSRCLYRWVYYLDDRWMAEVLFDKSWRVGKVKIFRP